MSAVPGQDSDGRSPETAPPVVPPAESDLPPQADDRDEVSRMRGRVQFVKDVLSTVIYLLIRWVIGQV